MAPSFLVRRKKTTKKRPAYFHLSGGRLVAFPEHKRVTFKERAKPKTQNSSYLLNMPSFLARRKKTKPFRIVSFRTSDGRKVSFKARKKPIRRIKVTF
jgi:hypothetical protein